MTHPLFAPPQQALPSEEPSEAVTPVSPEAPQKPRRGRKPRYSAEERKQRAELTSKAQSLAASRLKEKYADEFHNLYEEAKGEVGLT